MTELTGEKRMRAMEVFASWLRSGVDPFAGQPDPPELLNRRLERERMRAPGTEFNITVNKAALIDKIRTNRDEHRAIFDAAIEGYRRVVTEALEARIRILQDGKTIEQTIVFAVPVDHTEDFTRVLDMLEMDLEATVTIDEARYRMYVDNEWDWARNFASTNSGYTTGVAGSSYGKFLNQ